VPVPDDLTAAAAALVAGRLVVYPTETFYGIGVRALLPAAVRAVAVLKERDVGGAVKPIAVIAADRAMIDRVVARVPAAAEDLMARFWPGPLTLVLPARDDLPPELTAGSGVVGVRVSSHPLACALAAAVGEPITATSANRAGGDPACDVGDARAALGAGIDVYLDGGRVAGGSGSTVVVVADDGARVVRAGVVSIEALRDVLGVFPLATPS
jgi:L-threonylcarbamoyladenylate synthase